jgi:hypothetical protein
VAHPARGLALKAAVRVPTGLALISFLDRQEHLNWAARIFDARNAPLFEPESSMSRHGEFGLGLDQLGNGCLVGQLLEAFDLFLVNGSAPG